jgi:hypothetical protein
MASISQWKLSFQVSPIFLTGPPVSNVPSGMVPFLSIVNPGAFPASQVAGGAYNPGAATGVASTFNLSGVAQDEFDLDNAFGAFNVMPGGTLVAQTVAKYPFANQAYAANAIIRDPLHVSLIWDTPMRGSNAWGQKLTIMQTVKARLDAHNNAGGTYVVATPSYIYDNLIMIGLSDASRGSSQLPQNAWRFDFERPLVTLQDLHAAQSALMSKITNGVITDGSLSGAGAGLGSITSQPQMGSGPSAAPPSMTALGVPSGRPSGPGVGSGANIAYSQVLAPPAYGPTYWGGHA